MCSIRVLDPSQDMCRYTGRDLVEQRQRLRAECLVWVYPNMTSSIELLAYVAYCRSSSQRNYEPYSDSLLDADVAALE